MQSSLRARYHTFKSSSSRFIVSHVARTQWLPAAYFSMIDRVLSREAHAMAAGQVRYAADQAGEQLSYYLLRRNVHRLEKALIMRPRRPSFAADYILETVECYSRAIFAWNQRGNEASSEIGWAYDVLSEYFSTVVRTDAKIQRAYNIWLGIAKPRIVPSSEANSVGAIPYLRDLSNKPPVEFSAFMALCRRRRSVRWYEDRPVPREMVDLAVDAAAQAPSACNRQPFVFRIFDDPELAHRLAAIPMGTAGFSEQIPSVVVLVGRLRAYPYARDRHAIYIDGSLAAMSFMFALETQGVATCAINWPDQEPHESKMKKELGLDDDERVIMLISYGWPDPTGKVPYSAKRGRDELRIFNQISPE
jgi:nitroreductase